MIHALLLLAVGALPPSKLPPEKTVLPPSKLPPAVATPAPKAKPAPSKYVDGWHYVQPGEQTRPAYHWHHCERCGRAVQHGPENNGNKNAHTCPCGNTVWQKYASLENDSKSLPYCPT